MHKKKTMLEILSFIFISFFITSISYAHSVTRLKDERVDEFANRMTPPGLVIQGKVRESTWNGKKVIVVFYGQPSEKVPKEMESLTPTIFVDEGKSYSKLSGVPINRTEEEADLKIKEVFFANADKDKDLEMVILAKNACEHFDFEKDTYQVFVYDNLSKKPPYQLTFMQEVSTLLDPGIYSHNKNGTNTVPESKAKFKTSEGAKRELKKLGF